MNEQTDSDVLTARQIETLRALTDRLIPADADTPGGAEGGALAYILRELEEGGNLAPFRTDYRAFLDVLDEEGFAGRDSAAQDDLLRRIERGPEDPAQRRRFALIAEHAQEGYYTDAANWPSIGYIVTG